MEPEEIINYPILAYDKSMVTHKFQCGQSMAPTMKYREGVSIQYIKDINFVRNLAAFYINESFIVRITL